MERESEYELMCFPKINGIDSTERLREWVNVLGHDENENKIHFQIQTVMFREHSLSTKCKSTKNTKAERLKTST